MAKLTTLLVAFALPICAGCGHWAVSQAEPRSANLPVNVTDVLIAGCGLPFM